MGAAFFSSDDIIPGLTIRSVRERPDPMNTWKLMAGAVLMAFALLSQAQPVWGQASPSAPEPKADAAQSGRSEGEAEAEFPDPDLPPASSTTAARRTYARTYRAPDPEGVERLTPPSDYWRADELDRAYQQGIEDGRNLERMDRHASRTYTNYQQSMAEGHRAFAAGRYGDAARAFLLAAQLNQGDPAARLCAAHARTALGHYEPAAHLIRRAFELQPRMAYLPIDIRTAYAKPGDFESHLEALNRSWEEQPNESARCLVLGYTLLFSKQPRKAESVLGRAMELDPADTVVRLLHEAATLSNPPSQPVQAPKAGPVRRDL